MSTSITFPAPDGAVYIIPSVDDENWGQNVSNFLIAIPGGVPPRNGTFALTGDLSFGPSFGLLSQYFKTLASNPASAGLIRLSKTDVIDWRNNANSANLPLGINGSDQLTFNGVTVGIPTLGNLTDAGTDGITVTGGTNAVVGSGTSLSQHIADASHNGYLSSTDWSTFNNKQPGGSYVTTITGTANQVNASPSTGAVTLSTPQDIAPASSPSFVSLVLSNTLTINPGGVGQGTMNLGNGSGSINISNPVSVTSYSLNLPGVQGAAHTAMFNDGSGNLAFQTAISQPLTGYAAGSGTVSSADSILQAIQKIDANQYLSIPKVGTPAGTGTVTPNASTASTFSFTVSGTLTINGPSNGTDGQKVTLRILNDASHTVSLATGSGNFRFGTDITSYTNSVSKTDYIGAVWNSGASRWDVVSVIQGF